MRQRNDIREAMRLMRSNPERFRELANASPYYRLLGMEVLECRDGYARFRLPFKGELKQLAGVVHGGAITSIADSAGAIAVLATAQDSAGVATAEMKLNFIAPTVGNDLFAEAHVVHCGSTLAVTEVEVTDGSGILVAKGLATYVLLSER